ncbi:MAG TPA: thioredoxin domain-containing protein [Thermoanaerobaculia bacterium]|nr:thioredoxin domain-containing protein [Thermoanaerobaculia bacterium]
MNRPRIRFLLIGIVTFWTTASTVWCGERQVETPAKAPESYTNHLANEQSPYLQLHAHNPVDWYPWGEEAFRKAKEENKPIFLSIGYATCHWCHVMEQESFSDPLIGEMMNATFVSIKVDREERPDIDSVYMTVSQMITGGGGWPLNILMTPDKKPFFVSTYIPKEDRFGRPGLLRLIPEVAKAWRDRTGDIRVSAEKITAALEQNSGGAAGGQLTRDALKEAYGQLASRFDPVRGGFLPAPKFPAPHQLLFLLRYWKRTGDAKALSMVEKTLEAMRRGGIFDQIGFGFHRYSTDPEWLVPHFEKMLYDQAMLAMAYTEAYQATHKAEFRETAQQIFEYVLRDMRGPTGGFYSAEDADSEGREGKFYLWTEAEIRAVTGPDADLVIETYGIKKGGNFTSVEGDVHANVLHLVVSPAPVDAQRRLEAARKKLFAARGRRVHPSKDDKILTDWNRLTIAALAEAAQVFDRPDYDAAARRAADFLLTRMRTRDGRLLHRFRGDQAAIPGKLDDYAFLTWGLLNLYESSFDIRYLQAAIDLQRVALQHFADVKGRFFLTADDAEQLLTRPKESFDGAIPSGNSAELLDLIRIGRITGDAIYESAADKLVRAFSGDVTAAPYGHTALLSGLDFALGPSFEIVLAGTTAASDLKPLRAALGRQFLPNKVVLFRPAGESEPPVTKIAAFTRPQVAIRNKATAYVCTNYVCKLPTTEPATMVKLLTEAPR